MWGQEPVSNKQHPCKGPYIKFGLLCSLAMITGNTRIPGQVWERSLWVHMALALYMEYFYSPSSPPLRPPPHTLCFLATAHGRLYFPLSRQGSWDSKRLSNLYKVTQLLRKSCAWTQSGQESTVSSVRKPTQPLWWGEVCVGGGSCYVLCINSVYYMPRILGWARSGGSWSWVRAFLTDFPGKPGPAGCHFPAWKLTKARAWVYCSPVSLQVLRQLVHDHVLKAFKKYILLEAPVA